MFAGAPLSEGHKWCLGDTINPAGTKSLTNSWQTREQRDEGRKRGITTQRGTDGKETIRHKAGTVLLQNQRVSLQGVILSFSFTHFPLSLDDFRHLRMDAATVSTEQQLRLLVFYPFQEVAAVPIYILIWFDFPFLWLKRMETSNVMFL